MRRDIYAACLGNADMLQLNNSETYVKCNTGLGTVDVSVSKGSRMSRNPENHMR